jgi:ABC-type sugar transport system ATPase subunit
LSSVELAQVTKRFGDVTVLHEVSMAAQSGEFLVLLGPSGCGKSTSLRIMAGLERADEGDVLIAGDRVNDVPAARRRTAMVFQNYALYPHLSVAENIVFGLRVRKVARAEREARLRQVAEMLDLVPYLDRKPAELSGGQRQRVALGRALVSRAKVILMDEPLSNLDAKLRQQMRVDLRALQRELGLTVVYVTHDQVEAMTMADRVVVMRDGLVEQVATPVELYQEPASAWVARFIGSPPMNLLPGAVAGGRVAITPGEASASPEQADRADAEDVWVGIRPEEVRLVPEGDSAHGAAVGTEAPGDDDHLRVPGVVRSVEILGADTLVAVEVGCPDAVVARVPGISGLAVGQQVVALLRRRSLTLFDRGSGRRLDALAGTAGPAAGPTRAHPTTERGTPDV